MPKTTKLGFAYPEEGTVEWYQTFKALIDDGIDAYLYAVTRKLIPIFDCDTEFSWVTGSPDGTLSWTVGDVKWNNPHTGEQIVLRQDAVPLDEIAVADGEFVYFVVAEGSGPTIYIAAQAATQIALNPGGIVVIGQRVGANFFFNPAIIGFSK